MSWQADQHWADQFDPDIEQKLTEHAGKIISFRLVKASAEDDQSRCIDAHLVAEVGNIALRVRRRGYKDRYEDLTIRAHRDTGTPTELAKLREGFGRFYFYGWEGQSGQLAKWMLVDLDVMRDTGLLFDQRRHWDNRDGTYFVAYSSTELYDAGCLVASDGLNLGLFAA